MRRVTFKRFATADAKRYSDAAGQPNFPGQLVSMQSLCGQLYTKACHGRVEGDPLWSWSVDRWSFVKVPRQSRIESGCDLDHKLDRLLARHHRFARCAPPLWLDLYRIPDRLLAQFPPYRSGCATSLCARVTTDERRPAPPASPLFTNATGLLSQFGTVWGESAASDIGHLRLE